MVRRRDGLLYLTCDLKWWGLARLPRQRLSAENLQKEGGQTSAGRASEFPWKCPLCSAENWSACGGVSAVLRTHDCRKWDSEYFHHSGDPRASSAQEFERRGPVRNWNWQTDEDLWHVHGRETTSGALIRCACALYHPGSLSRALAVAGGIWIQAWERRRGAGLPGKEVPEPGILCTYFSWWYSLLDLAILLRNHFVRST